LNYKQLKEDAEILIKKNKKKYLKICLDELKLNTDEKDLIILLRSEYIPIYISLKDIFQIKRNTTFLGIVGVNGSGKTTLSQFLKILLQSEKYKVITFSMDDLYPKKSKRLENANEIDPSLKTRLMYDNKLVREVFSELQNWTKPIKIPKFDKAIDDRASKEKWLYILKKPDFVIVEGVFTFAKPIPDTELTAADKFLNSQVRELANSYDFIDFKLTLLTDSIDNIIPLYIRISRNYDISKLSCRRHKLLLGENEFYCI